MFKNHAAQLGFKSALTSFIIGTIILGLFIITRNDFFALIGWMYTPIAGIINLGILLYLIIELCINAGSRSEIAMSIVIMLLNIPFCAIYTQIGLNLLEL